jgi:hypothetical protein
MAVVAGMGNPPPPPAEGYVQRLSLDRGTCGWLFVRTRTSGTIAIEPNAATEEDTDGSRYLLMIYRRMRD